MLDQTETTPAASTSIGRTGTAFEAVGDAPAQHDGQKLMVTAYVVIWVVLMVWLLMMWNKARSLHARVDELDKALDRAAAKPHEPRVRPPHESSESKS